jgi:hypothetical protein
MMILVFLFITFFIFLIGSQIVLGNHVMEGLGQQSDLEKLDSKVDGVKADVFDLSLNVAALQKNVMTLMDQQTGFASSLKNNAMNIPPVSSS